MNTLHSTKPNIPHKLRVYMREGKVGQQRTYTVGHAKWNLYSFDISERARILEKCIKRIFPTPPPSLRISCEYPGRQQEGYMYERIK